MLRELIGRQEVQAQSNTRTLVGSTVSTSPSSAGSHPSDHRGSSDNASIMSKRSILSFRLGRPDYLEDLKESRAYKRLRHFGRGIDIDSSTESVFSSDSGCSTGHWSMLSDITLGDLSISQIAVLNLPINLADVSNPEPFQDRLSMETPRSHLMPRRIWSSRGRIHNAIENGNEFVVRTVLTMGMDLEELDSNRRTPLVHATMKRQEAICKLLLEKDASVEALKAFTAGMDTNERSELLDPLIGEAMDDDSNSVTVLRLLLQMALGTNYGDGNRSSSQSMINVAIDMGYGLAVRAIIHLEPQALVGVDTEGRTPFAYAYHLRRNEICEMLLQSSKVDIRMAAEVVKLGGDFAGRVHTVIEGKCLQLLWLLLETVEKIGTEGQIPLTYAAEAVSEGINYESWGYIREGKASRMDIGTVKQTRPQPRVLRCIATSMRELVKKDFKSILLLLSLMESRDAEGWTPLASAAFNSNEVLCGFLVQKGCSLCLDTKQKKQLKPKLSCRIHVAAQGGHKAALQLLLDMGADINERNSDGNTALLEAVYYNHLPCVKILIERGADATIPNNQNRTVLHRAAFANHDRIMEFLLENVVETRKLVDVKDYWRDTALHDCGQRGHRRPVSSLKIAKMLLQVGAACTTKGRHGLTAYGSARELRNHEFAKYLWSQLSPEQQARETPPPSDW